MDFLCLLPSCFLCLKKMQREGLITCSILQRPRYGYNPMAAVPACQQGISSCNLLPISLLSVLVEGAFVFHFLLLIVFQIPIALDMAADSGGNNRDLKKRMKSDPYFTYAIKECYASFKNIIYALVIGPREREYVWHSYASMLLDSWLLKLWFYSEPADKVNILWHIFRVIQKIFNVVDEHIAEDTLIKELNMSNLPTLSKKFIELLDLLV